MSLQACVSFLRMHVFNNIFCLQISIAKAIKENNVGLGSFAILIL
jgi:hypothetical protein